MEQIDDHQFHHHHVHLQFCRFQQNAKQEDIALKIDTALSTIEKTNQSLKGALPDNYFSRLGLTASKLAALIDVVNNIDTIGNPE